jgi:hypothetical protein
VLASAEGKVLYLSRTYEGSMHDKAIVDTEGWRFPQGITLHLDLGFKGLSAEGVNIEMPHKKPRTRDLTEEQKAQNKQKAAKRVVIEHCIGRVKIYRILKDRIRMYKQGIKDLVMELACALNNFKIAYKT